jgi:hypothetical protein
MPPFTTLELLAAEHRRLKELAAAGMPERRNTDEWGEHLAKVLRPNFGGRE